MAHPYISGAGNIAQMIGYLRKNFPATVSAETVKKFGLAPKNESYVINTLQFLDLIDADGKRTERGHNLLTIHNDEAFQNEFGGLVKEAYQDLFETMGDEAWTMDRPALINYFRTTDKTSDIIGSRQAGVFQVLRVIAGLEDAPPPKGTLPSKPKVAKQLKSVKPKTTKAKAAPPAPEFTGEQSGKKNGGEVALTVRIEINLPAEGTQEAYDNIFKSIRANLFPDV